MRSARFAYLPKIYSLLFLLVTTTVGNLEMQQQLLRRRDVEIMIGLSRSAIYALMDEGIFPRPIRIGKRAVAWRQSEIEEWMASRKGA